MREQKTDFQDSVSFSLLFTSLSLASTIEITFSSTSRTTAGCRQLLFNFCGCGHVITLSAIGEPEYSGRG